mmetsp:Transcript_46450/g.86839  ORF Transcript_46450/g.86839 Transcript_46450/m.86839 type:complete len:356 (+) Transcript_46450:81-1148(+)
MKKSTGHHVRFIAEGIIQGTGYGQTPYKVYESVAGLSEAQTQEAPYFFVWLHGMDNGSIEPSYLQTIQTKLQHRVVFMVPKSPNTTASGLHFNWGCAFHKRDNKKQLGYVFGSLHQDYLQDITDKVSELAYIFQAERTIVMGYSMGGFGAFQLGGFAPDVFDVVVSVAGYGLGTLEPSGEMYDAPQPEASDIFFQFLGEVASRLATVPIVLALHAKKDSMSSFRDVKAIIEYVKDAGYKRGSQHIVELFEVPDEKADSDRNKRKKRNSGHHYFNYALLDGTSEEFFWSKLQGFLNVAGPRMELNQPDFNAATALLATQEGRPMCSRCVKAAVCEAKAIERREGRGAGTSCRVSPY